LRDEINDLKDKNDELRNKLKDKQIEIEDYFLNRKSEAAMQLEIDHLKNDNIRLLELLKTTPEYQDFAYLLEDSTGVRYVKSNNKLNKLGSSSNCKCNNFYSGIQSKSCKIKYCEQLANKDNAYSDPSNWIPNKAFHISQEYSKTHNVDISETFINGLLSSVK
jgi:hypothetical protein